MAASEDDRMGNIERWTIWNTPNKAADGPQYNVYIAGPDAGDWASEGVEVVRADAYRGAVALLERAAEHLSYSELYDDEKAVVIREINDWLSTHAGGQ